MHNHLESDEREGGGVRDACGGSGGQCGSQWYERRGEKEAMSGQVRAKRRAQERERERADSALVTLQRHVLTKGARAHAQ